jgi:hypothetical protein
MLKELARNNRLTCIQIRSNKVLCVSRKALKFMRSAWEENFCSLTLRFPLRTSEHLEKYA